MFASSSANGTGKSTLLEAIAAHYGFGREGGSRNLSIEATSSPVDEPEATLSPQRQLTFLLILHDLLKDNEEIQFLIDRALSDPAGIYARQILSFDSGPIRKISYCESQLVSRFVAAPERYINALFSEPADSE